MGRGGWKRAEIFWRESHAGFCTYGVSATTGPVGGRVEVAGCFSKGCGEVRWSNNGPMAPPPLTLFLQLVTECLSTKSGQHLAHFQWTHTWLFFHTSLLTSTNFCKLPNPLSPLPSPPFHPPPFLQLVPESLSTTPGQHLAQLL